MDPSQFDIHKMDLIRETYDKKINTPDPPHGYLCLFVHETTSWIKGLSDEDREYVFEYIKYILSLPDDNTLKEMTKMLMTQLDYDI